MNAFSFTAPSVWNLLPAILWNLPTLSEFKTKLKAFLFGKAFHKPSATIPANTRLCGCLHIYTSVCEWCAHWSFVQQKDLHCITAYHYYYYMCTEKSPGRPSKYLSEGILHITGSRFHTGSFTIPLWRWPTVIQPSLMQFSTLISDSLAVTQTHSFGAGLTGQQNCNIERAWHKSRWRKTSMAGECEQVW